MELGRGNEMVKLFCSWRSGLLREQASFEENMKQRQDTSYVPSGVTATIDVLLSYEEHKVGESERETVSTDCDWFIL